MTPRLRVVQASLPQVASNARATWSHRVSVRVRLEHEGAFGLGEAAPLPGYSDETFEAARNALETWDGAHRGGLEAWPRLDSPAATFAAQAACLDLGARLDARPAPEWLAKVAHLEPPRPAPVTALVTDLDGADVAADRAVQSGFRHLKLKVGRPGEFGRECAAVRAARARLPDTGTLTVDVNQAFAARALPDRLRALADLGVDLVEEPAPPEVLDALTPHEPLPVPIALDESLRLEGARARVARLAARGRVRALVLKPAVLGGVIETLEWARIASALGLSVRLSHLFDGPVAHRAYAALALVVGGGAPQGLGPHVGLEAFGGPSGWPVDAGWLRPSPDPGLGVWEAW